MDPHGALYLQIADTLAQSIRAGTLARGERMPSVRDLARRHGVSVSTAVQAYRSLEDAQLIEARPRSGYFVAARPPRLPEPEVSRPPELLRFSGRVAAHMIRVGHDPQHLFGTARVPTHPTTTAWRTVSRATSAIGR
jgi:DNA-binding GntR family transcriptional regulator